MGSNDDSKKLCRQLQLFHIFRFCEVTELREIVCRIRYGSVKTIQRDIQELMAAGVVAVRFSQKEKGYLHQRKILSSPPLETENLAKNQHLKKLHRLCQLMAELPDSELPYWDERPPDYQTLAEWYKKTFPDCSRRTMQRDFAILKKVGYRVFYNPYERCYTVDFPGDLGDEYLPAGEWLLVGEVD